jgi:exodeoxyribonuclease VIII
MNSPHVMLDLETMGVQSDAAIAAIGAVAFQPDDAPGTAPAGEFYRVVDLDSSIRAGGSVSATTIAWWLGQSAEAQAIFRGSTPKVSIRTGLRDLRTWLTHRDLFTGEPVVWANGAAFDIPILESALRREGLRLPTSFRNIRDCRTLFRLVDQDIPKPDGVVAHNALDDARVQAYRVQWVYRALGLAAAVVAP